MGYLIRYVIGLYLILFIGYTSLPAQIIPTKDSLIDHIAAVLILDSIAIQAEKNQPNVRDFIEKSMNDSTFYLSFRNLRTAEYTFDAELNFFDKKQRQSSFYQSQRNHRYTPPYHYDEILTEKFDNHYYTKRGQFSYLTARLYHRVFLTPDSSLVDTSASYEIINADPDTRIEKYIAEIKKLVFMPGHPLDIPFTGQRYAIFTAPHNNAYNYFLNLDTIQNRTVYAFQVLLKEEIDKKKYPIQSIQTFFDPENSQILGRKIKLQDKTLLYSFDVEIFIEISPFQYKYYPTTIYYQGQWNIPFKKPEICNFYFNIVRFKNE